MFDTVLKKGVSMYADDGAVNVNFVGDVLLGLKEKETNTPSTGKVDQLNAVTI